MKKILTWFLLLSSSIALSMDINGQLKKAQLEVLGSDPTGSTARIYYNSGDATFRYYNGAWRTIVDTSTALSNPMSKIGDIIVSSDNSGTAAKVGTVLLGDIAASAVSQSYAVTSASPGVFTVAAAPATGDKAYVTVTQNGFTSNTTYYAHNLTATTFQLCTTFANAVVGGASCITSSGTTAGTVVSGGLMAPSSTTITRGTTTNDSATDGYAGQLLGPIARLRSAATTLSTATTVNIGTTTSITLTPGDWDVRGASGFQTANTTALTEVNTCISKTSATLGASDTFGNPASNEFCNDDARAFTSTGNNDIVYPIPTYRVTVAAGATLPLFLVGRANFTGTAPKIYGWMEARRVR